MKVAAIALITASLVGAQDFSGEPECATACLTSAISVAGCALDDQGCQCGSGYAAIQTAAEGCLISACTSGTDLLQAASAGSSLCAAYYATVSASASTTASSLSSVSLSASPSSSVVSPFIPASSTGSVSTSTVNATTVTSVASTVTSGTSTTGSGATAGSKTTSSSSTSSNVGVVAAAGGVGSFAALLVAVMAAL